MYYKAVTAIKSVNIHPLTQLWSVFSLWGEPWRFSLLVSCKHTTVLLMTIVTLHIYLNWKAICSSLLVACSYSLPIFLLGYLFFSYWSLRAVWRDMHLLASWWDFRAFYIRSFYMYNPAELFLSIISHIGRLPRSRSLLLLPFYRCWEWNSERFNAHERTKPGLGSEVPPRSCPQSPEGSLGNFATRAVTRLLLSCYRASDSTTNSPLTQNILSQPKQSLTPPSQNLTLGTTWVKSCLLKFMEFQFSRISLFNPRGKYDCVLVCLGFRHQRAVLWMETVPRRVCLPFGIGHKPWRALILIPEPSCRLPPEAVVEWRDRSCY